MIKPNKIAFFIGAGLTLYWLNSNASTGSVTKDTVTKDVDNLSDTIETTFTSVLSDSQAQKVAIQIQQSTKPYESLFTRSWLNVVQIEVENQIGNELTFEKMQTIQTELQNVFRNSLQYKRSYLSSYFKSRKYNMTQEVSAIELNLKNVSKYL